MLPPLRHILDPREQADADSDPIVDSVNIPLSQLRERMGELPAREVEVLVAAERALLDETLDFLLVGGRNVRPVAPVCGERGPGRLWKPNDFLMEQLGRLPAGRAYDLGCGSGRDAVALAAHGWEVVAIDRFDEALEEGRRIENYYLPPVAKGRIDWRFGNLERLSLQQGLLLAFKSLDRATLRNVASTAPPGCTLLFEGFTPTHADVNQRPRPNSQFDEGFILETLRDWTIKSLDSSWRHEESAQSVTRRHTLRLKASR